MSRQDRVRRQEREIGAAILKCGTGLTVNVAHTEGISLPQPEPVRLAGRKNQNDLCS